MQLKKKKYVSIIDYQMRVDFQIKLNFAHLFSLPIFKYRYLLYAKSLPRLTLFLFMVFALRLKKTIGKPMKLHVNSLKFVIK